jgi:dihydrofolate reductase
MGRVIVIEFVTLDGIVTDPDGSDHTAGGGWAFRHGPEAVAGDKFALGAALDDGAMLLGRVTWEKFARIWPGRDDEFAARMNAVPKFVLTADADLDVGAWANSRRVETDLRTTVSALTDRGDVVVAGSINVVRALGDQDLVDEYRLLTFPTVVGTGERLFPEGQPVMQLTCTTIAQAGPASLAIYEVLRS